MKYIGYGMRWFDWVPFYFILLYFLFFILKLGILEQPKSEWNSLLVARMSQVIVANANELWMENKFSILLWFNYREENRVKTFVREW